ncbi:uncharacterized protein LOC126901721 isoform X1 [Daktulosphaira vitifoliae]|uniref:uncharacterized protein LOC126901721 isoform X1 n=1 Tax=Daktulosphaira vitifoliae TaxID=58002 RepID=UPI0021AB01AD|nr:uncharacterized protein LOC126901721 isoform X1 [Daktulosphaira vitifoliae]
MNHLKLTKVLLEHELCDYKTSIYMIHEGNAFVKKQLASLYFNQEFKVGSLWLLNIYTSTIGTYVDYFKNSKITKENYSKVTEILKCHEYVYEKLDLESKNCDKTSRFYINNLVFNYTQNYNYDYLVTFHKKLLYDIDILIETNNSNGTLVFTNTKVFQKYYLYLNRFGVHTFTVLKLINSFNLRIHWGDITTKLADIYNNANKFDWPIKNFRSCLLLYSTSFNLFKVIMLRLTWKQFLYIQHQNASLIENLTKQWLLSLKNFASFLALEKDVAIKSIIESISLHIKSYPLNNNGTVDLNKLSTYQQDYTDKLVDYISYIISILCEGLGCTIVENWNTEEVLQISNQVTFYSDRILHNKSIDETTESDEITDSNYINNSISVLDCVQQDFGRYLSYLFKRVNFNIIRSFIEYLETLNTYNLFDE